MIRKEDKALLMALREDARMSISELARTLNISRSTVKDRLARLESTGVIKGYSLVLGDNYLQGQIVAHVMVNIDSKQLSNIVRTLRMVDEISMVSAVSGVYDLIVVVKASSMGELDSVLDQIGDIEGVEKTLTNIILSTKFDR